MLVLTTSITNVCSFGSLNCMWTSTSSYLTCIDSNEQNYTAGDPTPVLYIKNLAKDVVVDDFYFIFG